MKAGQTKIDVGIKVKIKSFTGNDSLYNGWTGTATHPFASGCTDKGWIGIRMDNMTVYGYQLNAKETEVEIINNNQQN
jgi:hypothetical protein